ncbi:MULTISPECIES: XRE family transcriptional regulator [Methylobacterium]|uniref:HTH cro/C1-type domain-containing protein n=3 Tax=Pseudomonadota TaxID=1224 RepID=A0ABQ4T105_9HYPH|nr:MULTISPECIES: XRE family transcriptional regulator [Methylobacterium]GBU17251.1 hypothetical protein AwMethylo_14660 [Methylobacterium sp.]GJE07838.1 hypothetical protein AOPFMNJM_3170 [Methylobacterium jeotgali]
MVEHARIVARRVELGISQAELARRVGISQPAIVEIEKGRVQSTRYVNEIARALDLQPYEIDPKFGRSAPGLPITVDSPTEVPLFNLLIREGQAELSAMPFSHIARPTALHQVWGAYAVMLGDETMSPEFEPGDTLHVNPHLPTLPGYSYLFREAEDSLGAMVRRLVSMDDSNWVVRAWRKMVDGEKDARIKRTGWPMAHRIVGKTSRG